MSQPLLHKTDSFHPPMLHIQSIFCCYEWMEIYSPGHYQLFQCNLYLAHKLCMFDICLGLLMNSHNWHIGNLISQPSKRIQLGLSDDKKEWELNTLVTIAMFVTTSPFIFYHFIIWINFCGTPWSFSIAAWYTTTMFFTTIGEGKYTILSYSIFTTKCFALAFSLTYGPFTWTNEEKLTCFLRNY